MFVKDFPSPSISRKYITVMVAFRFTIQNCESLFIHRDRDVKQYLICEKIIAWKILEIGTHFVTFTVFSFMYTYHCIITVSSAEIFYERGIDRLNELLESKQISIFPKKSKYSLNYEAMLVYTVCISYWK